MRESGNVESSCAHLRTDEQLDPPLVERAHERHALLALLNTVQRCRAHTVALFKLPRDELHSVWRVDEREHLWDGLDARELRERLQLLLLRHHTHTVRDRLRHAILGHGGALCGPQPQNQTVLHELEGGASNDGSISGG